MTSKWYHLGDYSPVNKKPRGVKKEVDKNISLLKNLAKEFPKLDPEWGREIFFMPGSWWRLIPQKVRLKLKRRLLQALIDTLSDLYNKRPSDGYSLELFLRIEDLGHCKIFIFDYHVPILAEKYEEAHYIQQEMLYNNDLQKLGLIIPSYMQVRKYKESWDGLDEEEDEQEDGYWNHEIFFQLKIDV